LKDDGIYTITNPFRIRWDFGDKTQNTWTSTDITMPSGDNPRLVEMLMETPTIESERIVIRGEQGTQPTIDCEEQVFCFNDGKPFVTWQAMKFINSGATVIVGTEGSFDSKYVYFDLLDITMTVSGSGSNVGGIMVNERAGDYGQITRVLVNGPGTVGSGEGANTGTVFLRRVNHYTIDGFTGHNAALGLYFKHPNDASLADGGTPTLLFKNMYFYNCDRDNGMNLSANGATIENCVLIGGFIGNTGGLGENSVTGGNDNTFDHITFTGSFLSYDNDTEGLSPPTASNGNALIDCILPQYNIWTGSNALTNTSTSNYTLYANDIEYKDVAFTLAAWQSGSTPASQDVNSLSGSPTFLATPVDGEASTYELDPSSLGYGTGSSSSNMGADVTTVGAI